jgi:hypothetical protein
VSPSHERGSAPILARPPALIENQLPLLFESGLDDCGAGLDNGTLIADDDLHSNLNR